MKKIFIFMILLMSVNVRAQDNHYNLFAINNIMHFEVNIKKHSDVYTTGFINNVKTRVIRHFIKTFNNTTDVRWFIDEEGATAYFICNNEKVKVRYDKNGQHLSTRKTYDENKLDPLIAQWVKLEFGEEFVIYLVTEVIKDDNTIYEITLQNQFYWCIENLVKKKVPGLEKLCENKVFIKI